jgi:hypothetical protein
MKALRGAGVEGRRCAERALRRRCHTLAQNSLGFGDWEVPFNSAPHSEAFAIHSLVSGFRTHSPLNPSTPDL